MRASQVTSFVWGGCMMLRQESLGPDDEYGIVKVSVVQIPFRHNHLRAFMGTAMGTGKLTGILQSAGSTPLSRCKVWGSSG
jgi:hypothetical protein